MVARTDDSYEDDWAQKCLDVTAQRCPVRQQREWDLWDNQDLQPSNTDETYQRVFRKLGLVKDEECHADQAGNEWRKDMR